MERTPSLPPAIASLSASEYRPQWSVMIPSYKCIRFLGEAIKCVLGQDMGEERMQIEVVDDYSTDGDVEALVKEIGRGRVGYFRQEKNVGSLRNFETCINRAKGRLVHILHGDDLINPGFYEEVGSLFQQYPEIGAAITKHDLVDTYGNVSTFPKYLSDKPGIIDNWLYRIATRQLVQPPAVVVKREVYEKLGSFFGVHYGEDWEMWIRIAANYPVAYTPKTLALYRDSNEQSISGVYTKTGRNVDDILKVIEITQAYLPAHLRKEVKHEARKNFSMAFASAALNTYRKTGNVEKSIAFFRASLRLDINWRFFYRFAKFMGYYMKDRSILSKKRTRVSV